MRRRFLNNIKSISGGNHSEYFTIEAIEDSTFKLTRNACEYSLDEGETWVSLAAGTNTPTVPAGSKIMFKATNPSISTSSGIGTFSSIGKFNAEGNIMSMLYGDDFIGQNDLTGKDSAFYQLFSGCTNVIETHNLILPATTLASRCYGEMFRDCSSLTSAPELPATTLSSNCYSKMFRNCTSLTAAPELPATNLSPGCYDSMFKGCTSLTSAPELPATTLASSCYASMFYNCSSLTSAPELPATTLASGCYKYMFKGCTSLTAAPELPATTLVDSCYVAMFSGCKSLTSAPELPATKLASSCYYCMFDGTNVLPDCSNIDFTNEAVVASVGLHGLFAGTKVTDADLERILPKNSKGKYCLPATTLAKDCYNSMFDGCRSLNTAPELPATTLAKSCYSYMFYGCTSLNNIVMLATNISATECLLNWVSRVAKNGTFVKHPDMNSLPSGENGIPNGWTVEDYVETNLITFRVIDKDYQAEEGMTWNQWLNSEYNTINAYEDSGGIYIEATAFLGTGLDGIDIISYQDGTPVLLDDIIINNHDYTYIQILV